LTAAERGDVERAGRLWGAVEAEESRGPVGAWVRERARYEQRLRADDDPALERARGVGRALSIEEAVDEALDAVQPNLASLDNTRSADRP
jgi:hypothetical protein